jgi:hypothetical protein
VTALVQKISVVEIAFCDVERVLEYTSVPAESGEVEPLPAKWPVNGRIEGIRVDILGRTELASRR